MTHQSSSNMTSYEKRNSVILGAVYSLRLFGMFLVLPVFSLYAQELSAGDNVMLVGLAFGIYGLTQAIFQLPLGMASDKWGRKKIIFLGMLIFAVGSFLCAYAETVNQLMWARAIQGAGAVSAVVTALLADLTRDEVRTRAMAMIGVSISLTFSVSLFLGPILSKWIGVDGIFVLTGVLILVALLVVMLLIPTPQKLKQEVTSSTSLKILPKVLFNRQFLAVNFGIFALHCAQMSLFIALPFILVNHFDLLKELHWYIYLPATLLGMLLMIPVIIFGEVKHQLKAALLLGVVLLCLAQLSLGIELSTMWQLYVVMGMYFVGMNIAEAILPSWVSKIAPIAFKGTAMGVYNTLLSLGLFSGSVIGAFLINHFGLFSVFYFNVGLMILWLIFVLFDHAPLPVKTLIFSIPKAWQNQLEVLHSNLEKQQGVQEISFDCNANTLYLKVLQNKYNEDTIINLINKE